MAKKPRPEPNDKEWSWRLVETAKSPDINKDGKLFEHATKIVISPK